MRKLSRNALLQLLEVLFWVFIIVATLVAVFKFQWSTASNILQYLAIFSLLFSVYFYLKNRTLYHESKAKTEQLLEKQRELHERQKTIDLIFDNSADGILIINQDKQIQEFSPGMEKITGYKRSDAIGRDVQQLLKFSAEKNHSLLPDLMFTIPNTSNANQYAENSLITKIGKIVDVEASHTLIHDQKSNRTLALAIIRDITFEKNLIERDKEFITVTSHQLNTPLSIIKGYSSLLAGGKAGKLSDKQSSFVHEILSSTEKMISLTNSMLSISRIEQEKIKLDLTDVNINDLINSMKSMFAQKIESKGLKLDIKSLDENLIITADQDKLQQAISNLIDNAIKYTPKGRVTLSVVNRPEVIDLVIADTGIGIPATELERIGTRFYRTQGAIDVDNHGTGLGIFIAKTIADKHQGHLKIESIDGKWTKVTMTLPKKQKTL